MLFDPDSFYNYIVNHYGHDQDIVTITPHGHKTLENKWTALKKKQDSKSFKFTGCMFMHDQEPMVENVWANFKNDLQQYYKCSDIDPYVSRPWLADLPSMDFFLSLLRNNLFYDPIFCHSQSSPGVVEALKMHDAIDAHYFYHASLARSWFGEYKYWSKLDAKTRERGPNRYLLYCRGRDGTRSYRNDFIARITEKFGRYWCDFDRSLAYPSDESARLSIDDAERSLHIVLETVFDHEFVHLTEKIFKSIVMSQPFVLVSSPGSLAYLRNYGFQTFDTVWDESYDLIQDHRSRMDTVIDLLHAMDCMTDSDFHDMIDRCYAIVDHNRRWFYSEQFESKLMAEIHTSINTALTEQARRYEENALQSVISQFQRFQSHGIKSAAMLNHFRQRIQELEKHSPTIFQRSYDVNKKILKSLKLA